MPKFETYEEADKWRDAHIGKARGAGADERQAKRGEPGVVMGDSAAKQAVDLHDWEGKDFEQVMLEQSERVPKMAYAIYEQAVASGSPVAVEKALKNWSEASKQARLCRSEWYDLLERSRVLIHLDEVRNEVGIVLTELRRRMDSLGSRCAATVNPANPDHARSVIDAEVDKVYAMMEEVLPRVLMELTAQGGGDDEEAA